MPTVTELKAQAKERGLKGYSKMKKADLEKLLSGADKAKKVAKKVNKSKPPPKEPEGEFKTGDVVKSDYHLESGQLTAPGPRSYYKIVKINKGKDGGQVLKLKQWYRGVDVEYPKGEASENMRKRALQEPQTVGEVLKKTTFKGKPLRDWVKKIFINING